MPITRTAYLTESEATHLRDACREWAAIDRRQARRQGIVTWLLVDLALTTGLRTSELADLRVGDFDSRRRLLRARRVKSRIRRESELPTGSKLADHLEAFICWKRQAREPAAPSAHLLTGKRGPYSPNGLWRAWKRALERAELPSYKLHAARHTVAVQLLRRTSNLRLVQQHLGHSDIRTTAHVYAAIPFEDDEREIDGLY